MLKRLIIYLRRPVESDHEMGFKIAELKNIQDIEVGMSNKRLEIKDLGQRHKFENHYL